MFCYFQLFFYPVDSNNPIQMHSSIDTIDTLVLDYLVRQGHQATFAKLPSSSFFGSSDLLQKRAEICKLVKVGRFIEAVGLIEAMVEATNFNFNANSSSADSTKFTTEISITSLRKLTTTSPLTIFNLLFLLKIQHFIELIRHQNTVTAISFVQSDLLSFSPSSSVLTEVLGILAYVDPINSEMAWLFEQPRRYADLASLTNSSLYNFTEKDSSSSPFLNSPIEILLKHVNSINQLVVDVGGFGNDLDDRKWSVINNLTNN